MALAMSALRMIFMLEVYLYRVDIMGFVISVWRGLSRIRILRISALCAAQKSKEYRKFMIISKLAAKLMKTPPSIFSKLRIKYKRFRINKVKGMKIEAKAHQRNINTMRYMMRNRNLINLIRQSKTIVKRNWPNKKEQNLLIEVLSPNAHLRILKT